MAKVTITIYKYEGKFFPFEIKEECGECSLSLRIIKDVIEEFGENITFLEFPWLTYWYKPIVKGGWHAPIVMVNGKILSQGVVVDRDELRSKIIKEIYRDYKIEKGAHIFTLPDCKHCMRAKNIFAKNNIKYEEHNVIEDNIEMQKMLSLVLGKIHPITLPQIFINGTWIKSADELEKLDDENTLKKLISQEKNI